MLRVALQMLTRDHAKYAGLVFGTAFTAFLVTFAASFFCGFLTRGFALVAENPEADVWVMDPAVTSVELTTSLPDAALYRVRSVAGVEAAFPLLLATAEGRFPNGAFQSFQVIGLDAASLAGLPELRDGVTSAALRAPDAAVVDPGGTTGKLETPTVTADRWPAFGEPRLGVPTRPLAAGDEILVNDHRVRIVGRSNTLARFPPRPLLYMTRANAERILPPTRERLTFVLVRAADGFAPARLAARIEEQTGLRARSADELAADTVRWYLNNSEDVGDVGAMLSLAITVGFGLTAVMLYMFTAESLKQYAVLHAMGATPRRLLSMVFAQATFCAFVGSGIGLGICGLVAPLVADAGYPFRMMWFTPVLGLATVLLVSVVAALLSARPVLRLEPMMMFARR